MAKKRMLFVGHSLSSNGGLGYVSSALLRRYYDLNSYDIGYVTIVGPDTTQENIQCQGAEFKKISQNINIYNCQLDDPNKVFLFEDVVRDFKPSIVISIHDPWCLDQIAYSQYKDTYFWVAYLTIETPLYPEYVIRPTHIVQDHRKSIKETLLNADLIIPVSRMGANTLRQLGLATTEHVYCGVDLNNKVRERKSRDEVFKSYIKEDDFLFMTMGVNNERKKIDRLLEAFFFLIKDRPDKEHIKLYVHTDISKIAGGTDILQVISDLKIGKNIVLSIPNNNYSTNDLYHRYNCCDCYVSASGGEGFGYGYVEAMLHDKPVIYGMYGAHAEICEGHGLKVKVKDFTSGFNAYIKFALLDIQDLVLQMTRMLEQKELRDAYSEIAYKYVAENFDWNKQFIKFNNIVEKEYSYFLENTHNKVNIKFGLKRVV